MFHYAAKNLKKFNEIYKITKSTFSLNLSAKNLKILGENLSVVKKSYNIAILKMLKKNSYSLLEEVKKILTE